MRLSKRLFLPGLLVPLILLAGCTLGQSEPAASQAAVSSSPVSSTAASFTADTSTPTDGIIKMATDPAVVATDLPTTSATPEPPQSPTPSPQPPTWLYFTGVGMWADAIWAADIDGAGFTQLNSGRIIIPRDLEAAASPKGGRLAFITAGDFQLRGLSLNLLTLPDGEVKVLTPLSSPETEPPPDADPALRPPEPLVAIAEEVSLAWSPDGRLLAFTAAFQGPTSDLYLYSLDDESIIRLTDGPSQAIRPIWSPDGETILHFGVETLGSGAGYTMSGVWAVEVDRGEVTPLYDPSERGNEIVAGWISDDTFVVYSQYVGLDQAMNLRTVDVETADVETADSQALWPGALIDAAVNPNTGALLVAAGPDTDRPEGLYHLAAGETQWIRIVEDAVSQLLWSEEAGLFLALTEHGVLAVSRQGDFIDLDVPETASGFPAVAPKTKQLAWTGSGLWIGSLTDSIDRPPRLVYDRPASHASWGPEGQNLIFYSDDQLLAAAGPDFEPVLVAEGLTNHPPVLIRP